MRSEGRLDAVDGLFGFLDHAVEQNLDRHDIVHETHAHAGAEDRAVDIAVLEGYAGLLAGDDGHLLLEDVHRALAGAQAAVLDLVGEQGSVVLGHAHHAADGLLAEYGVLFGVVDDPLAVVVGDRALIDAHEAGAHGNAGSAERERSREAVAVVNGTESRALSDPVCFARTPYHSLFLGRADRKFQQRGGLHENSVQFHQTVRAAREVYRVNTLMLEVSEPDADGYLYYGPRGTAWSSLDTQVEKRIYQVNAFQQRTRGEHHRIHVSEVTALCRADHPLNTYHYKAPDALDARIAAHILPLVRDGDTLQVGIGGIPNAVAYGLHGRKRLGIYTEVLTQAQLRLMASGAVDLDRVEASIVLDAAGHLDDFALAHIRMIPVDVLNDPFRAAQQPGLISVNGCLMADLTGQVCAEAIDGRQYSGVGGQLDFVRAAARSVGGRSFLCLHSTHEAPDGTLTSNIRAHLPSGAVVTTPRSDVMYIVTEWGAADLHNQPLETRICAMIRIAHPRFRCALAQEAVAWGQLSPECAAQFDTQPEPEEETT